MTHNDDWSTAPEWAMWCVTTPGEFGVFTQHEPEYINEHPGHWDLRSRSIGKRKDVLKGTWPGSDAPRWQDSLRRRPG